jgi:hypothetical protein
MRRIYRTDGKFQIENLVVPGSSSSANTGTAVLNFGSIPGTNVVTTTVTGQTSILSNSYVQAWLMGDSTATHNAYEHNIVPIRLVCGNIVAGTGFDIVASTDWRLTGTFSVRWMWN